MTPTSRSLAKLRADGWKLVEKTEHYNAFTRRRHDLFQFIDLLAIDIDRTLAVQTTSGDNVSARLHKMETLPSVVHWLSSPTRRIVIHGWSKRGGVGKRKLWTCRECEVVLNETGKPVIKQ